MTTLNLCVGCKAAYGQHEHHVVPKSMGGVGTVWLCEDCHSKIHGKDLRISALTKAAMQKKATRGEYVGGKAPYGYRLTTDGKSLEPNDDEQAVVAEAKRLRSAGLSLREIATTLDENGVRSRVGKAFAAEQIRKMVSAPQTVYIEPDEYEQTVIAEAKRLRASGLSLREVAATLEEAGHLSRTGRPFAAKQILRMVAP